MVLSTDPEQMNQKDKLNIILDTVSFKHDVNDFLKLLKVTGPMVLVGYPAEQLPFDAFILVNGNRNFAGSNTGGTKETQEVLGFCAENNIVADIEPIKMQQVNGAFDLLLKGDMHYRFVIDMTSLQS